MPVLAALGERPALEVERAHVQAEAVHEDDGRLVGRPCRLDDLDVQVGAVRGGDRQLLVERLVAERLVGVAGRRGALTDLRTSARSTANAVASPAAATPTTAPTMPDLLARDGPRPAHCSLPVVHPRHPAAAEPGDDLVVDRADRLGPVVGGRRRRRPGRTASPRRRPATGSSPTSSTIWSMQTRPAIVRIVPAELDRAGVGRVPRHPVGVAERDQRRAWSPARCE